MIQRKDSSRLKVAITHLIEYATPSQGATKIATFDGLKMVNTDTVEIGWMF